MHKIDSFPMAFSPPTFKTATPTSRTQLKLQLMREQLQEQERREAEFRQNLQQQRPTTAPPRPVPTTTLSTIGVDVPPQVLQVCMYVFFLSFLLSSYRSLQFYPRPSSTLFRRCVRDAIYFYTTYRPVKYRFSLFFSICYALVYARTRQCNVCANTCFRKTDDSNF